MGPVEFAIKTPKLDLQSHIDHALSLNLPEADSGRKHLNLIANGPSASLFNDAGETMAINGALSLFTQKGQAPTYWIACDPQEQVADFLLNAPESTLYLVASKCHPKVFRALSGRKAQLWHVNDIVIPNVRQVPCAVSVTLCSLLLAQRMGYRTIDVWGWDLCYDGDKHHAGPGELGETPGRINIEVGEGEDATWWVSNPTWCCEAKDASGILPVLKWVGCDVRIHGKSMLAAILPEYASNT